MKRIILAGALAFAAVSSAHAVRINDLYNTGIGANGAGDTHYSLNAASSDTVIGNTVPVITLDNVWPISPWLANDGTSKWITPTASQGQSFDAFSAGTYTYTLSFDLTGYNAGSAGFTGRFAADNDAVVKLNNQVIASGSGFTAWNGFAANSGFQAGVNTLQFVVGNWAQNGGNPTGLRVEFLTSSVTAVPEPSSYAMLLAGLVLVGVVGSRRKQVR
ncbi:PEP-CTERM sorting domain-containing protein [Rugamonas aquatica]|uniref:PEP-CTERM sorting domain-containing protein n=1 Tax=Rugamonas aquatica TaxID=2743357 RepID=A0A6A7MWN9_9BURK|nr:PEP-CTERM sorting domain-containing protein [Rugamonas aquatica]MQA37158.1 PEP-CTERM sorting domain-containing protein [Rugamonas aquatica]